MKGFVTVILFFLLTLAFAKAEYTAAAPAASAVACTVRNADDATKGDNLLSLDIDRGMAGMDVEGARTLSYGMNAFAERMCRFSSIETALFMKTLLCRMAVCMTGLVHCHAQTYDSSRCLAGGDACEHYIFGMRRILI